MLIEKMNGDVVEGWKDVNAADTAFLNVWRDCSCVANCFSLACWIPARRATKVNTMMDVPSVSGRGAGKDLQETRGSS
jgi:hypothetical protein